jgi:hypothetical protein
LTLAPRRLTIYIDREVAKRRPKPVRRRSALKRGRKRVLVVLFGPSVERDGTTPIDQDHWVDAALEMFGRVFGRATAYPKAKGIWRDDERSGALVKDEPVVAIAIRRLPTSRIPGTWRHSGTSAERWAVRPARERLGW